MLLTSHGSAFGTARTLPRSPQSLALPPGAEMQRRLAALDAPTLEQAVGDLLGERERAALLARLVALLERSAAPNRR